MNIQHAAVQIAEPKKHDFQHVVPAQTGTMLLHAVGDPLAPYIAKQAVIAWGITAHCDVVPFTVVGAVEDYHAVLTPDGLVDNFDKPYSSYEAWYHHMIEKNTENKARRR